MHEHLFGGYRLIDISPKVSEKLRVWPGDVPYHRSVALDTEQGDHLTLSAITTTVHLGAHADAPNHYGRNAPGIDAVSLEPYLGTCQVIKVSIPHGERIEPSMLANMPIEAPRVLFRTDTYPDPQHFNEDFASLSPSLVQHLHESKVQLVGIDTPSIDLCHDKELISHQAVLAADMRVLEGLCLGHVEAGIYQLIALPLPLLGCDASPVRAILLHQ